MRRKQALALGIEEFELEKQALKMNSGRLDADEIRHAFVGKTVMPPAFSGEFAIYFVERENHLATQQKNLEKFQQKLAKYQNDDRTWNGKYDEAKCEYERVSEAHNKCQKQLTAFYDCMKTLGCSKLPSDAATLAAALKIPAKAKLVEDSIFHACKTCNQSTDQHLMAHCDSCNHYYHLGCLDPPLTKLPRKTSLYGWECASCCHSSSSDDGSIELNAPRQLRSERKRTSRLVDETLGLGDIVPRKRGRPRLISRPEGPPKAY